MYDLIRAGERTYYINAPVTVGVYKLSDNEVCLIDSGNNPAVAEDVLTIIENMGWNIKMIINTHSHADHIGGNGIIQEKTGCKIYACEPDRMFVLHPELERPFLFGGWPIDEISTDFFLARPSDAEPLDENTLPEGLEMVRLDGHAVCMAGIKTSDDIWFVGDIVSSEETLKKYPVMYLFNVENHLKSLERVKTLQGKMFIPAHEKPMTDIRDTADLNIKMTHMMIDLIRDITKEPINFEEILKKVFDRFNLRLGPSSYVLTGSTVKAYLSYLHNRGELEIIFSDSRLLWHTIPSDI